MSSRRSSRAGGGHTNDNGSRPHTGSARVHRVKPLQLGASFRNKEAVESIGGMDRSTATPRGLNGSISFLKRVSAGEERTASSGGRPGWITDRRGPDADPANAGRYTGRTETLRYKDDIDSRVEELRTLFKEKQSTSHASIQDVFRAADVSKSGLLGPEEWSDAMHKLGLVHDDRVVDRLLRKYAHRGHMDLKDFTSWFDDSAGKMILATPPGGNPERKKVKGDHRNAKHLWIAPDDQVEKKKKIMVGKLNEVLELEKRTSGRIPPRLDTNFSSVQYDILSFSARARELDPRIPIPVKSRIHLFDAPPPSGRRVAYHHGDTPYDIVTVRTPRSRAEPDLFSSSPIAPVRLCTFSRIHQGQHPTQLGHELGALTSLVI